MKNLQEADAALAELRAIVGSENVLVEAADLVKYESEWTQRFEGRALAVARPGTSTEVQALVRWCHSRGVSIVPQSGNTGMLGGAVPIGGELVISLTRLNRIRSIDPSNATITVDAGMVLADLQEAASAAGLFFPLSLGSEASCLVGGNLSTNAGGNAVLRFGNTRDLTLGLEVVLPDGRLWNGLRGLRKDNSGYDLKQLFIGAEGSLGIITAATFKLFPKPLNQKTVLLGLSSPMAVLALLQQLRGDFAAQMTGFEVFSALCMDLALLCLPERANPMPGHRWYVLLQLDEASSAQAWNLQADEILSAALEKNLAQGAVVAQSAAQARDLWRIRESIPIGKRRAGFSIAHDISLPISCIPDFLAEMGQQLEPMAPGIRTVAFGHWGDGNVHFDLLRPAEMTDDAARLLAARLSDCVYSAVVDRGGSFSAEHGIGQGKKQLLKRFKDPVELELMQSLKKALDPSGLMNPGKIF